METEVVVRRILFGLTVALAAAVLTSLAEGRLTILHVLGWTIWNLSLFWIYLFGRDRSRRARCGS